MGKIEIVVSAIVSALIVLGVVLIFAEHMINLTTIRYVSQGSAGIRVILNANGFIVGDLKVGINGSNTSIEVPVKIVSRCFVRLPIIPQNATTSGAIPRITTTIPYVEPCNLSEQVVFSGLRPFTIYNVSVSGSESPYCAPGTICPMFILHIQKSLSIETEANGTIVNASFSI